MLSCWPRHICRVHKNSDMKKQVACSLLLTMTAGLSIATPQDWCIRPEARDYRALDLKPGSAVKAVVYPHGLGYGGHRQTFSLSADGLLRSIRTEYPGQDCVESFVRDDAGALLARKDACAPKPSSSPPITYQYESGGWSEINDKGTETTTVVATSKFGAVWRVQSRNIDRAWPMPPGSFVVMHFDDRCREVGRTSFMEMRVAVGGPVPGATINLFRTITPRPSGYERTTVESSRVKEVIGVGDHGFVIDEQYFDAGTQRSPIAVRETNYKLDARGNWTSKRIQHRDLRDGGPASLEAVDRELSYHR